MELDEKGKKFEKIAVSAISAEKDRSELGSDSTQKDSTLDPLSFKDEIGDPTPDPKLFKRIRGIVCVFGGKDPSHDWKDPSLDRPCLINAKT